MSAITKATEISHGHQQNGVNIKNFNYKYILYIIFLENHPDRIPFGSKCTANQFAKERILNGVEAVPNSWPWLVT